MNEMKDKWINDIRSRMDNYSEPLPVGLWEKIESEISTPAPKVIPMWRKWTSVAAAAALVLAISSVSVWYWSTDSELKEVNSALTDNNEIRQEYKSDNVIQEVQTVESSDKQLQAEAVNYSSKTIVNLASGNNADSLNVARIALSENIQTVDTESTDSELKKEVDAEDEASIKENRMKRMREDRETVRRNASYLAMSDSKRSKGSGVQLGVMTGNIPYSSSNSFSGMSRLAIPTKSVSQVNDVVVGEVSDATASYSQMLFNNMGRQTYTDIKHHMPVTVGASVKWNLNEHWALESGLNYTYLYSELRSGAKSYIEDKQKLHYVGIPLKVQRSVWSNSIFSFYASAGGMMEKCVSGSVETVCVDDNNRKSFGNEKLDVKPLQFSVLASVGLQANFNKLLSLYLEPGMIYYFDDNTDIITIRKDKPFNFNLQLGLRFNLNK
ncbi:MULTISPECIES: outer membrane beta-barrel protein [Bacteroides]|uniref:outer membrane beta-barrel protein n=1 Tax=Bacteroides TaxID=816 RepID=UPI001F3A0C2A|nr:MULTISPECIES: outer membrane beta-barrel protein [Bacteroides]MCF2736807.1 PorT family protein [Bacteroides caecigallinarum]MCR8894454.1 PorT family protein [Bacteroides sp. ET336]MDN0058950.1 outer membrane beta-barrel protein [Bacteroides caecigallinarum]